MHRRNILSAALAATGALFAAGSRAARADAPDAAKVVYHLADLDKVQLVLGNIDTARKLASAVKSDVRLAACGNTMRGQNVTLKDLLPGFSIAERGGVVLIAELQAQGYVYLRP